MIHISHDSLGQLGTYFRNSTEIFNKSAKASSELVLLCCELARYRHQVHITPMNIFSRC